MTATLEALLKRDRIVVLASIVAIGLLSWLYLFHLAADMATMDATMDITPAPAADPMDEMPGMEMPGMQMPGMEMSGMATPTDDAGFSFTTFTVLVPMWLVMMVGMMLPSAAPAILLFSALERKRQRDGPHGRTALFVAGYFIVWSVFSIVAAAMQAALSGAGFMSMQMAITSGIVGGVVFILAGLYEFTPLKNRCLSHCRSPLEWIAHHHRPGSYGALRMGVEHGVYCVGCCWMLMLLLFVGGVMNLLWVAAIALVVLVEKLFPRGALAAKIAGLVLFAVGLVLIARPILFA